MVRLKVRAKTYHSVVAYLFQFHYGSVKRTLMRLRRIFPSTFQFHYGSVKSDTG